LGERIKSLPRTLIRGEGYHCFHYEYIICCHSGEGYPERLSRALSKDAERPALSEAEGEEFQGGAGFVTCPLIFVTFSPSLQAKKKLSKKERLPKAGMR
jgi:hypothetical protein